MSFLQLIIIALFFSFIWLYFNFKNKYRYWEKRGVKVIKPIFPFGNVLPVLTEIIGFRIFRKWYESIDEKVIGLYAFNDPILLVRDPEIMKTILVKYFNYFSDRGIYIDNKEPTAGHLWKLRGEKWKPLRTKMTPCFSLGKLRMMFSTLLKAGQEKEKYLETNIIDGNLIINIDELYDRYTVDVIASSIFGVEINSYKEKNNQYYSTLTKLFISDSTIRIIKAILQVIAPNFFEFISFVKVETVNKEATGFVYQMVDNVIKFREKTGTFRNDMMQLLIQLKNDGKLKDTEEIDEKIKDEAVTRLTMHEVVAQAYTYFWTGSETSSGALIMLVYETALNETIQRCLQEDIDNALKKTNGEVTYEAVLEMKYLEMVIYETLRKYPILPFLSRRAVADCDISELGLKIEKGTRIYYSIQGVHWDPKYYPDPEKFDPERFSKNTENENNPSIFFTFGDGPRNCIGKRLAFFMMAVGVIFLFRKFNVSVCDKTEIPIQFNHLSITLKPSKPVYLKLTKR